MLVYGSSLEKRQLLLGRFADIGAELFAMSAALTRTQAMIERGHPEASSAVELTGYFCCCSQLRIAEWFRAFSRNADNRGYHLAQKIVAELPQTLFEGILRSAPGRQ
jgi:hypothetical protein